MTPSLDQPSAPRIAAEPPEQGQLVEVRARRWVVADIDAGMLEASPLDPAHERQHLVTLRCVDDDAGPDESLQVIWEVEPGARVLERAGFSWHHPELSAALSAAFAGP